MKIPLLIINDSASTPMLEVSGPERFDPLVFLHRCPERKVSDWNFIDSSGYRLGYYAVARWTGREFLPVTDFDEIPALARECGYDARYSTEKLYVANIGGVHRWITYYTEAKISDSEDALHLIERHIAELVGSNRIHEFVLSDRPPTIVTEFWCNDYDRMLTEKYNKIYTDSRFDIFFFQEEYTNEA
ncbi:MAG: hypothetical protein WC205_19065 [Opitutaceae bacterium]|jgi:hypothetical protein